MECKFRSRHANSSLGVEIRDHNMPQVTEYAGFIIQNHQEIEDVNYRIQVRWMKSSHASSVICDRKVSLKPK